MFLRDAVDTQLFHAALVTGPSSTYLTWSSNKLASYTSLLQFPQQFLARPKVESVSVSLATFTVTV